MEHRKLAPELCILLALAAAIPAFAQGPPPPGPVPPPEVRPEGPPPELVPQEGMPPRPPEEMRPPMDLPESLEDMLGLAMRNSAQVRVAEAKVREAEAELMQVRQQTAREVSAVFHDRIILQLRLDRLHAAAEAKQKDVPEEERAERENQLRESEADLDAVNAQLRYLMGVLPGEEPREHRRGAPMPGDEPRPAMQPRPPVPDRFAEALQQRMTLSLSGVTMIREVVDQLGRASGLNFICSVDNEMLADVALNDTTILDAMNALAEVSGNKLCFVFRDYGVLATSPEEARMIPGPAIPGYIPCMGPTGPP